MTCTFEFPIFQEKRSHFSRSRSCADGTEDDRRRRGSEVHQGHAGPHRRDVQPQIHEKLNADVQQISSSMMA